MICLGALLIDLSIYLFLLVFACILSFHFFLFPSLLLGSGHGSCGVPVIPVPD